VAVGSRRPDDKLNATAIADQVALTATFSSIGRIECCLLSPKTARIEQLSIAAHYQSIWLSHESQFSKAK
jgi:hypothetical protein